MSKITAPPTYLGDGVYVRSVRGDVLLTTGSHHEGEADNRIVLEPEVLHSLLTYLQANGLMDDRGRASR